MPLGRAIGKVKTGDGQKSLSQGILRWGLGLQVVRNGLDQEAS